MSRTTFPPHQLPTAQEQSTCIWVRVEVKAGAGGEKGNKSYIKGYVVIIWISMLVIVFSKCIFTKFCGNRFKKKKKFMINEIYTYGTKGLVINTGPPFALAPPGLSLEWAELKYL